MSDKRTEIDGICQLRRQFDDLIGRHQDDGRFCDAVKLALDNQNLPDVDEIRREYQELEADRDLRIGIVGAVKAGKSSLLNALFFGGKDILPKAATPMTAALTELSYGEKPSISVEFFTDDDVQTLERGWHEYQRQLEECTQRILMEKQERQSRRLLSGVGLAPSTQDSVQKQEEIAQREARREVEANEALAGAFRQYEEIRKCGAQRKTGREEMAVSSVNEIAGRLGDFVGSNGRYMPFTSRVELRLPFPQLRGITVIDTPGFNDPVLSRNDRARKSLKRCDVVLILSPAGRFLSNSDKEVLQKLTRKEGIRELYLIQSQVDSQLFNMEILDEAEGNLDAAVSSVRRKLVGQSREVLRTINQEGIFDSLIQDTDARSFATSGLCQSMAQTLEQQGAWDDGRKKVWENLCKEYPDYFSARDRETSENSLRKLGNFGPVEGSLSQVKERKQQILEGRLADLAGKYHRAAMAVRTELLQYIQNQERTVKEGGLDRLEKEVAELERSRARLMPELQLAFECLLAEWVNETVELIDRSMKRLEQGTQSNLLDAKGSYIDSWTTGHLFWKKRHSREVTTLQLSAVKDSFENLVAEGNRNFTTQLKNYIPALKDSLRSKLSAVWKSVAPDVDPAEVQNKLLVLFGELNIPLEVTYDGEEFSYDDGYGSDRLTGSHAEDCIRLANSHLNKILRNFKDKLHSRIEEIRDLCGSSNFVRRLFEGYTRQLQERKLALEEPQVALENYRRLKTELEGIV